MRFHGRAKGAGQRNTLTPKKSFSVGRAFQLMHQQRLKNKQPFGEVLGNAILSSIQTLVMVGGFIILFSVLTKLLFLIQLTPIIALILEQLFQLLTLPVTSTLPRS